MPETLFHLASRILIVDDEKHIARFLEFLLRKEGYQTAIAYDGIAAIEQLRAFRPDAVLLDLILPRKSGLDVLQEIRDSAESTGFQPVVLLLTGLNLQDLPADIMSYGVTAHCAKPVAPSTLLRLLHSKGLFGYSAARMNESAGAAAS